VIMIQVPAPLLEVHTAVSETQQTRDYTYV